MKDKKKNEFDDDFKIDESQYEITPEEDENTPRPTEKLDETEVVPVDERKETMEFPWFIAIIIGVLMLCIIACFIVIMVFEH